MTYAHLITDEPVIIKAYYHRKIPFAIIAERLKKPLYNVITFLKLGHTALNYYNRYQ